jgi:hypothetical protein
VVLDHHILALDVAGFAEAFAERNQIFLIVGRLTSTFTMENSPTGLAASVGGLFLFGRTRGR